MKYPFHDSTNISIRLLRSGPESKDMNRDDQIAIVEKGDDLFELYYHSGDWETKTAHCVQLTGDELDQYLYSLFFLLTRDSDPFRSVQFNVPCMPSILILMDDMRKKGVRDSLSTILPLLRSCIKVEF
jgi:hypothetical protein